MSQEVLKPVEIKFGGMRSELYSMIARPFPPDHPIHLNNNFINFVSPFSAEAEGTLVTPDLKPEEVDNRLKTITNTLRSLLERNPDGSPFYSFPEAMRAYTVIGCNWLTLHGCLGRDEQGKTIDGHGRAMMQLLPITLAYGGYYKKFNPQLFKKNGHFNPVYGKTAVSIHGTIGDGLRLTAGRLELVSQGDIHPILRDPIIIGHKKSLKEANAYARSIISSNISLLIKR